MGIFMDRSTLPSADPSTVWLADLIEATEVVAASAEPCDPVIVKAFRHRLETRADARRHLDPAFAHAKSIDEEKRFLRRYCDAHPLGDYLDGVLDLIQTLPTVPVPAPKTRP